MKFVDAKDKKEVVKKIGYTPEKIVKIEGGYAVFDTITEYETWKKQR